VETVTRKGYPCLKIPYYDENHAEITFRLRWNLGGDKGRRFTSKSGSRTQPYGLWLLAEPMHLCSYDQGIQEYFLVEGESDAQTCWYYGIRAFGIPGSNGWRSEFAKCLDGYIVYLWQEPGEGGQRFVDKITKDIPHAYIMTPPADRKDISECHLWGDDIPTLIAELMGKARPFSDVLAERFRQEAREAAGIAAPLLESATY